MKPWLGKGSPPQTGRSILVAEEGRSCPKPSNIYWQVGTRDETAKQGQRRIGHWCLFMSEDGQAARALLIVPSSFLHVIKPIEFLKSLIFR